MEAFLLAITLIISQTKINHDFIFLTRIRDDEKLVPDIGVYVLEKKKEN